MTQSPISPGTKRILIQISFEVIFFTARRSGRVGFGVQTEGGNVRNKRCAKMHSLPRGGAA
jgi:hypothetical protein